MTVKKVFHNETIQFRINNVSTSAFSYAEISAPVIIIDKIPAKKFNPPRIPYHLLREWTASSNHLISYLHKHIIVNLPQSAVSTFPHSNDQSINLFVLEIIRFPFCHLEQLLLTWLPIVTNKLQFICNLSFSKHNHKQISSAIK